MNTLFERAMVALQRGDRSEALQLCAALLKQDANHAAAHHLYGVLLDQSGKHKAAVAHLRRAVGIEPQQAVWHDNLGLALQATGDPSAALAAHSYALKQDPSLVSAAYNAAASYLRLQQPARALQVVRRGRTRAPEDVRLRVLEGTVLKVTNDLVGARAVLEGVLREHPSNMEAVFLFGAILIAQGEIEPAITFYRTHLQARPDDPHLLARLGPVLEEAGRFEEAQQVLLRSLEIRPRHVLARHNLAVMLQKKGDVAAAIPHYNALLRVVPGHRKAMENLVTAYINLAKWVLAARMIESVLARYPDHALACVQPHVLRSMCLWPDLPAADARADRVRDLRLASGQLVGLSPLMDITRRMDPDGNRTISTDYARSMVVTHPFSHQKPQDRPVRLRIGYLSYDFRDHPVAHLIAGLFCHHDRTRFEVVVYSYGPNDSSAWRQRIEQDCDHFCDLSALSDKHAAARIHDDAVDVLIDLMGPTQNARPGILAHRPAPVQVTWLGYPGTTGSDWFDAVIGDLVVSPPAHAGAFSERLALMPHAYQVNDNTLVVPPPPSRDDAGLPREGVVFCSFNKPVKLDPVMFACWMRILKTVPGSVLWLYCRHGVTQNNLRKVAEEHGVPAHRIVFASRESKVAHLSRLQCADIALDTRIYNGHTSTSDALYSGVPVLTVQGAHFASRVSASLLCALGLPELITDSVDAYESLAVALAVDVNRRQALRRKVIQNRQTHPLFDTNRFCRNLEQLLDRVWEDADSGSKEPLLAIDDAVLSREFEGPVPLTHPKR